MYSGAETEGGAHEIIKKIYAHESRYRFRSRRF